MMPAHACVGRERPAAVARLRPLSRLSLTLAPAPDEPRRPMVIWLSRMGDTHGPDGIQTGLGMDVASDPPLGVNVMDAAGESTIENARGGSVCP